MEILYQIFIFCLGLSVGSFLNVIIYRLPKEEKIFGRSYCPHCKKILAWYDLIPVFSFLVFLGKCRYCSGKISWQYPLVEISTAFIFLAISNEFPVSNFQIINTLYLFIISCFLIIIFAIDLKYYLIPDKIIYPAIIITIFYQLFGIWNFGHWNFSGIWNLGLGILPAFFLLGIIIFSAGRWMGLGDFKLAIWMGLFLSWPKILAALFLAFLLGAIIGSGLVFLKKKEFKSEIPLGPFLVSGTFIAFFWGENLINWYLTLFK